MTKSLATARAWFGEWKTYRLWRSLHFGLALYDVFGTARRHEDDHGTHLRLTLEWLKTAQNEGGGAMAGGWSFAQGWLPASPGISGELVETFVVAGPLAVQPELSGLAQRLLDSLLAGQSPVGAMTGATGAPASILDQGLALRGLLAGHTQLGRSDCRDAALRLGRWLVERQRADGSLPDADGGARAYNVVAAWALARLGAAVLDAGFTDAARRALAWTLAQQTACGWFANNAAEIDGIPTSAEIARTLRGVLETAIVLRDESAFSAAEEPARRLLDLHDSNPVFAGRFDDDWEACTAAVCLSGVAQMAALWLRLAQSDRGPGWSDAADTALRFLKRSQRLSAKAPETIRGALPGAAPLWAPFARFVYPADAAKHFVDSLVMDRTGAAIPPAIIAAATTEKPA